MAHFRMAMNLPGKLKDFLLHHQGIFYISRRGNHGLLHTVFLREAYRKGDLIEPNELYSVRRNLAELILLSPRKAPLDKELVGYSRRKGEDDDVSRVKEYVEDSLEGFETEENYKQNGHRKEVQDVHFRSDVDSFITDEDDDMHEVEEAEDARVT
ncbi:Protein ROOT PRIMORDIUM DEFTIVE 1 [Ancistrocladus abbreviatus]